MQLLAGTHVLSLPGAGATAGDLDVSQALELRGALDGTSAIDAAGIDRALDLQIGSGAVTVVRVALRNGTRIDGDQGGAVEVESGVIFTFRDGRMTGNSIAGPGSRGGAVYVLAGGVVILEDAELDLNSADWGGAIECAAGAVCTFRHLDAHDNIAVNGGAISAQGSTLNIFDSDVRSNQSAFATILLANQASATVRRSSIRNNTTSGGGAVHCFGATLVLAESAILDNVITTGGALSGDGATNSITVMNSTISGNESPNAGAGIRMVNRRRAQAAARDDLQRQRLRREPPFRGTGRHHGARFRAR